MSDTNSFNHLLIPAFIGPNAPDSNTKGPGHCFTASAFAVIFMGKRFLGQFESHESSASSAMMEPCMDEAPF